MNLELFGGLKIWAHQEYSSLLPPPPELELLLENLKILSNLEYSPPELLMETSDNIGLACDDLR